VARRFLFAAHDQSVHPFRAEATKRPDPAPAPAAPEVVAA
jgi:hypothetical protein